MDLYSPVVRNVIYPFWVVKNRSRERAYLEEFEKTQFLGSDEIRNLQFSRLQALLKHAYNNSSFYKKRFDRNGLTLADIRSLDDICQIPQLTKSEIQEHAEEMISRTVQRHGLIRDMTGGSTGSPLVFYYDRRRQESRNAATLRHNRWAGWDVGNKVALLWGASRDISAQNGLKNRVRNLILNRQLMLDAGSLDEATMNDFAAKLTAYRPKIIQGYANVLALFARFVRDENLSGIFPRAIVSSAEVLTEENRRLIEGVFGCPVYNRYGSREFAVIASECERHEGMHVNAENLLVETLADRTNPDLKQILITDLQNYAMPMIRYQIGDCGTLKRDACGCGRGLPLMEIGGGRVTDFLTAIDGKKVSGVVIATYVITNVPGIRQVQIVQETVGRVTLRVAKGPDWSARTLDELQRKIVTFLGQDMDIQTEFMESLPAEPSGKYRFSVCNLP